MCTAIKFNDVQGNVYFGRNLDWSFSYGEKIVITTAHYIPRSPFGAITSIKSPIIGMGIIQEDTPLYFDCANLDGLMVAGLNFPGNARYEENPLEGKINVSAYEFPTYITANFSTLKEARKALENVAIINKPINEKYPCSLLHWIISDTTGSIVVEYTPSGMHIYDNPVEVLANEPTFDWHCENLHNYLNVTPEVPHDITWNKLSINPYGSGGGMRGLPGDYYSPSRFVRAAYLNASYPTKDNEEENISRLFHSLNGVSMIEGAARMTNGQFEKTVYTGGYSSKTHTYYYSTYDNPTLRKASLDDYAASKEGLITID